MSTYILMYAPVGSRGEVVTFSKDIKFLGDRVIDIIWAASDLNKLMDGAINISKDDFEVLEIVDSSEKTDVLARKRRLRL